MTIRLMSRRYVDALLQHTEATFVISGLWARTGFLQVPVPLSKGCKSTTSYGLVRRLKLLVNTVTAFSEAPPTRAPPTSLRPRISAALAGLTEPP